MYSFFKMVTKLIDAFHRKTSAPGAGLVFSMLSAFRGGKLLSFLSRLTYNSRILSKFARKITNKEGSADSSKL